MKKRRKRLRIDRIAYCLALLILFIMGIVFGIKALLNLRIYNSIKKNGSVKLYKQEVKVWKKTLNYVHDDIDTVTIKYRSNTMEMDSSKFKNGMNLKLNKYKKYIDEALFDNVKTLYIEKNDILNRTDKLTIKLPRYLYKNGIVDIYGVKNKNDIILLAPSVKVEDKYITFSSKYPLEFVSLKLQNVSFCIKRP